MQEEHQIGGQVVKYHLIISTSLWLYKKKKTTIVFENWNYKLHSHKEVFLSKYANIQALYTKTARGQKFNGDHDIRWQIQQSQRVG